VSPLWKDWQIEYLRANYGKKPMRTLWFVLKRSKKAVQQRAWAMGLGGKKRYRQGSVTPERYESMMVYAAMLSGVPQHLMFKDLRRHQTDVSAVKFAAWAAMRKEGATVTSLARASGLNHTSILHGLKRHAEMAAMKEAAE
jgi:hypothetical protein